MKVQLPLHKTKIVCTIGPASRSEDVLSRMLRAGMTIARVNLSHGTREEHSRTIDSLRSIAEGLGRRCPILVDLPGPKIRIGMLETEPVILAKGAEVTLTTRDVAGTSAIIPVTYRRLPESVSPGSVIYLNDGFVALEVVAVGHAEVRCIVTAGGPLLSGKGLNLPGALIFENPVTEQDLELMDFALAKDITTFGISFVERADDIIRARAFAREKGKEIYIVAKIERASAVRNIDEILEVTDAVMIARGDLGVEIPIEEVPIVQKQLIRKANLASRPVITATQMLESMVDSTRPTRAEATDVANAILDGTDAVMMSEETAIGRYPVETVEMMARIAIALERQRHMIRSSMFLQEQLRGELIKHRITVPDTISLNVFEAVRALDATFVLTATTSGMTARRVSRLKPDGWIIACNKDEEICDFLRFSYGVFPMITDTGTPEWYRQVIRLLDDSGFLRQGDRVVLTEGKFAGTAGGTDSMGIITIP